MIYHYGEGDEGVGNYDMTKYAFKCNDILAGSSPHPTPIFPSQGSVLIRFHSSVPTFDTFCSKTV
jgi:hypothetical protein